MVSEWFKYGALVELYCWENLSYWQELIRGYEVNNTTVCVWLDVIFLDQKLHVSAGSGHHQVLAFDSLKIILYNSRGGVFDEDISTSKPLLEHSASILGVWVSHVIIHIIIQMSCYVAHPHTQYTGTMLQQRFWCWDLLIKHATMRIV